MVERLDYDRVKGFITGLSTNSTPTYFIKPAASMWLTTSALVAVITTAIGTGCAAGAEATTVAQALATSNAASIKNTITGSYLNPSTTVLTEMKNFTGVNYLGWS